MEDPFFNAALRCNRGAALNARISKLTGGSSAPDIRREHAQSLEVSYSGNGLHRDSNDETSQTHTIFGNIETAATK